MYCGIWGLISFPSSSSSAGASPALRASSNSNCFLWSSLDLNAAANQIWPSSQDHLTHKNSHISKFGCKAVCQIQRTNEFHNYQVKETSTHEERERADPCENSHASTTSHTSYPWKSDFKNFGRRNEKKKRRPKHSERDGDKDDHTHTHTHTKREENRERDGDSLHDAVAMICAAQILPDPQSRIPAKWIPDANACMQHAWKQTKENKKRANALQKHQSAKP
jgi:hypothetical protein